MDRAVVGHDTEEPHARLSHQLAELLEAEIDVVVGEGGRDGDAGLRLHETVTELWRQPPVVADPIRRAQRFSQIGFKDEAKSEEAMYFSAGNDAVGNPSWSLYGSRDNLTYSCSSPDCDIRNLLTSSQ